MTVGEIPKAMPGIHLERSEDGDGVAFLDLLLGKDALMSTWVGEDDDGTPLTRADRTVQAIETFSPVPTTPDGVHVGMSLKDVEKIWGPVTKIEYTEIESREFVTFQRSPKWLIIRTYGGIYAGEDRTKPTRRFESDATIHSLAVTTLQR